MFSRRSGLIADRRDGHANYAAASGSGSGGGYDDDEGHGGGYSGGGGHDDQPCCPLVVDPFCLLAILAGIGFFAYFLNIVITMKLGRRRKRAVGVEGSASLERVTQILFTGNYLLTHHMYWARSK
jgi:hypothetical protein